MHSKNNKYWLGMIFFIASLSIKAQTPEFEKSIGNFKDASSFFIASNGIIYVTDRASDQIHSMDTTGNILKSTGGYGWSEAAFDDPADIFATPLNVYVTDKNNHRIQRFDRQLNYISSLFTRDSDLEYSRFGYPTSCTASNQGDLYIVDSENSRVIKFDMFGNYIQNFGGYDSGIYQLRNPGSVAISPDNTIYVSDDSGVILFDPFGNGLGRIEFESKPNSLRIIFDKLCITQDEKILIVDLQNPNSAMTEYELSELNGSKIVSSLYFLNKLYLLAANEVLVYSFPN